MNTSYRSVLLRVTPAVVGLAATGAIVFASLAYADIGPVVSATVRNAGNSIVASAPIGSILSASTTVATSSVSVPTGTVNFQLYQNLSCTGASTTQANVPLVNGSAVSATTTMGASGLSYIVHYNGDATSTPANSQCVAVTPTLATPVITTTLSSTTMLAGLAANDSATLANITSTASGTVSYVIYADVTCALPIQGAGVRTVVDGIVPNSDSMLFGSPGTYYWQAVYSGDLANAAATSTCLSEVLTVNATTTPPTPPAVSTGMVSGVVFNDANADQLRTLGEVGIAGVIVNLHSGVDNDAPVVASATTDAQGVYGFANLVFGPYYVEEVNMAGWTQTTTDAPVVLSTTATTSVVDFANVATTVPVVDKDHDHAPKVGHDRDDKGKDKEHKGKDKTPRGRGVGNRH